MARVLVLTSEPAGADVLPALALLSHEIHTAALEPAALSGEFDVVVVDGRRDLATARATCRLAALTVAPVLLVLGEGGFAAVTAEWGAADVVLAAAGPAEVEARMRLAATGATDESGNIEVGELSIDPDAHIARLRGRVPHKLLIVGKPGTSARDKWPSMIITAAPNRVRSAPNSLSETQPPRMAEA